jgi:tetratricopeptide (TPR) repeat protein
MKLLNAIIAVAIISSCALFPNESFNPEGVFNKANLFYQKGEYDKAIELYHQILSKGYSAKEVLFNIANSYYRLNQFHYAILYYERAHRLDPSDEDINFNLRMANLHIVDRFDEVPKLFLVQWWANLVDTYSSRIWTTVAILSIWISSVVFALFLVVNNVNIKKALFAVGLLFFLLFITNSILAYSRYHNETTTDYAIVFAINSYVKSSPDESSTDLFILHQGTKVQILDRIGKWLKIRIPNGNIGWIEERELVII